MRPLSALFAVCLACVTAYAQQSGPALAIDAAANQHPISPDIYGTNTYWTLPTPTDPAAVTAAADIRATARRWGGDSTSTYNWKLDIYDHAADWFFEVLVDNGGIWGNAPTAPADVAKLPAGSTFNQFADNTRLTGGKIVASAPILGWLPKARQEMCSFSTAEFPGKSQCKIDPYAQDHTVTCGDGILYTSACGVATATDGKVPSNPTYLTADPTDVYAASDQTFQSDWITYLLTRYGKGSQGGVNIWELDNEPIWWNSTHRDIHPNPYTYDELLAVDQRYAAAIKQADPTALVAGPVNDNWASLWFSMKDIQAGWSSKSGTWWGNPVDRNAHGGTPLLAWYLQQMKQYEQSHGTRLIDYVDMHTYFAPSAIQTSTDSPAVNALRLESTREFWDPTYDAPSGDYWMVDPTNNGAPVAPDYIPRVQQIIKDNYPGTKLAITEYCWFGLDTLNGGLAQADLLGIFGREGLDMAELWGVPSFPKPTDPAALAFKMYRNYDGIGGAFGETSVQATSANQSQLAVYAATRSDLNLTAVVINKTANDLNSTLNIANFSPGAAAKTWLYSGANQTAIVQQPNIAVSGNSLTATFPANSITMLVIPPATYPVPKPAITAVTSAASYSSAIAPGEMVVVWGSNLGPATLTGLALDSNGMVSNTISNVRVLFDGIPAPLVYVGNQFLAASTPYFGASKSTTHVEVEYQGVRSDPFAVAVSPTAPALFTADSSGKGQGSVTNADGKTANSKQAPAARGAVVTLWGTGEGITDPPGVDGRLAIDVLPKPVATVSVQIGGLPATVQYAGAAPYAMPGLFQINAVVPENVQPGDNVPVTVTIGSATSQNGVTLVVQ